MWLIAAMMLTTERLILREFVEGDWMIGNLKLTNLKLANLRAPRSGIRPTVLAYQQNPMYLRYYAWIERNSDLEYEWHK